MENATIFIDMEKIRETPWFANDYKKRKCFASSYPKKLNNWFKIKKFLTFFLFRKNLFSLKYFFCIENS